MMVKTLEEVVDFFNGKAPTYSDNGPFPIYGSNGIVGYSKEYKYDNSIILGRVGAYCGSVMLCTTKYWASDNTIVVAPKEDYDLKFIYYLLKNAPLNSFAGGAAQPLITQKVLKGIFVTVPPLQTQQKIGSILTAYDELMENNLKRIILLEKSARLLYEEWFVRLRFPGYEHTPIVDGVPEGWEKTFVPNIIEINPKTIVPKDGENWSVDMAALSSDSMVINNPVLKEGNSGSKFQNGDTLFARITPCLENGKTGYVNFLEEGKTAFGSTEFIVLRGKRVPSEFVYCLARTYDFRENAIKSMVGSSGRQRVQTSCFDEFPIPLPPKYILDLFEERAAPCFKQIKVLSSQNQKLKQARAILLPKLITGEIPV